MLRGSGSRPRCAPEPFATLRLRCSRSPGAACIAGHAGAPPARTRRIFSIRFSQLPARDGHQPKSCWKISALAGAAASTAYILTTLIEVDASPSTRTERGEQWWSLDHLGAIPQPHRAPALGVVHCGGRPLAG